MNEPRLDNGDAIVTGTRDELLVEKIIQFGVCRCRECKDRCDYLIERLQYVLCVRCNNYHTQKVEGVWVGPYTGLRT